MNNTSTPDIPTPDAYWESLLPHLHPFAPDERHAALALYRELAKGDVVDEAQLGRALGISTADSRLVLQRSAIKRFVYPDREGRVLGFGGLAVAPMHHRFEVDGRELSTWCAWDSLFIPEILGRPARITSADPESGKAVRLVVAPGHLVRRPSRDGHLIHQARCGGVRHLLSERDGEVLSLHLLFHFKSVGGTVDQKDPRHISLLARRRIHSGKAAQRFQFRNHVAAACAGRPRQWAQAREGGRGLISAPRYASHRQPNSGESSGGESSGVQPENFSIA
jgi:Alkylmercury lyase